MFTSQLRKKALSNTASLKSSVQVPIISVSLSQAHTHLGSTFSFSSSSSLIKSSFNEIGSNVEAAQKALESSKTIGELLEASVANVPTKSVFRSEQQGLRWNVQNLKRHSFSIANGLAAAKLKPGDVLAVALPANAENLVANLAAASIGVRVLNIPLEMITETKASESSPLAKLLKEHKVRALIVDRSNYSAQAPRAIYTLIPSLREASVSVGGVLQSEEFPDLEYVVHTGRERLRSMHRFRDLHRYDALDCHVKVFSKDVKGETGFLIRSDGTELSHKDVIGKAFEAIEKLPIEPDSAICLASDQQNHSLASVVGIVSSLLTSSQLSIPSARYESEALKKTADNLETKLVIGNQTVSGMKQWWNV